LSFQVSIQVRISALSWRTEVCVPRRGFLVVSSENHRSTRLSQDELVGVRCRTNRGCAVSQRFTAGVLWVEALSRTRCTLRSEGTSVSILRRNARNSVAVLCVDEKTQIQALNRTQPVFPMLPGTPGRASHDYVRHGTSSFPVTRVQSTDDLSGCQIQGGIQVFDCARADEQPGADFRVGQTVAGHFIRPIERGDSSFCLANFCLSSATLRRGFGLRVMVIRKLLRDPRLPRAAVDEPRDAVRRAEA
jgi:hypothetical protein